MAYFSNGTEAADWQVENCYQCRNYRSRGGDPDNIGCPIWDAHACYADGASEGTAAVLRILIPERRVGVTDSSPGYMAAGRCSMFEADDAARAAGGE